MAFPVNLKSTYVGNAGNPVTLSNGDQRRALSAAFAGLGTAFGVGGGVTRHGDTSLAVTVDGSDNVTVQAGAVVIPGDAVAGTGCYLSALGAATTNALAARDATNPRIDLIVFRQMDTDVVGSHGAYTARIDTVVGTPSATPAAPSKPSMAVELARITVPASGGGAASVDSSHRTYVSAVGGVTPVASASLLPAAAAKWDRFVALDTGVRYEWSGSAMAAVPQFASGSTTLSDGGAAPSTRAITFPAGRFTTAPIVQLTHGTGATSSTNSNLWVSGAVTTSGFTAAIARSTTTTITVYWLAVSAP
jgi:hypothetical protein